MSLKANLRHIAVYTVHIYTNDKCHIHLVLHNYMQWRRHLLSGKSAIFRSALPPTSLRSGRFNLLLHPWLHGGRYYIFKYFTVTWPIITIFICTLSDKGFEPGTTNEQPNAVLSLPNMIVHILVVSMVGLRRPHRCCCSCGGCCGRLFSCRRSRPMARSVDAWIWAAIFL